MLEKAKEIINHPYAAPVTETLKAIGVFAMQPLKKFTERIREAFDDDTYKYDGDEIKNRPKLRRMYERLNKYEDSAGFITMFGYAIGAIAGAATAGIAAYGSSGLLGAFLWGAAGMSFGIAAGPFVLAGVIALGAACTGLFLAGVPGLVKGCQMAIEHRKLTKAGQQVAQQLPAAQAQNADLTAALAKALAPFNDLKPEQRDAYVKMMNQQHQDAVTGQSEKLLQALNSLPDNERDALLDGLKLHLKDEFEKMAQRVANNSTVLQNEITTGGPIKLKPKKRPLFG
ncbi:MAG: hypothetical protein ACAH80_04275 [Alphaproteobacteria bacterium]